MQECCGQPGAWRVDPLGVLFNMLSYSVCLMTVIQAKQENVSDLHWMQLSAVFRLLIMNTTLLVNKTVLSINGHLLSWTFCWVMWLVFGWYLQSSKDDCVLYLPQVLPSEREEDGSACSHHCRLWKAASAQMAVVKEGGDPQGRWRLWVYREQQAAMWLVLERAERKRFFAGNLEEMCGICHKKWLKSCWSWGKTLVRAQQLG